MKQMKKFLGAILALTLIFSCFALSGCGEVKSDVKGINTNRTTSQASYTAKTDSSSGSETEKNTSAATEAPAVTEADASTDVDKSDAKTVEIDVKDYGKITLALYPKVAPITVDNFISLAESGFYDGLTFHRIMKGFMIQGGDPQGTGMGGSDKQIKGEFANNGVKNNLSHTRGVISMARATPPDSASSQFFICHQDSLFLDGNDAAFGEVTSGMEVVDKIAADAKPIDNNGTIPASEQPVINSVKVIG